MANDVIIPTDNSTAIIVIEEHPIFDIEFTLSYTEYISKEIAKMGGDITFIGTAELRGKEKYDKIHLRAISNEIAINCLLFIGYASAQKDNGR